MREIANGPWSTPSGYHHSYRHQFEYFGMVGLAGQLVFVLDSDIACENGLDPEIAVRIAHATHRAAAGLPVFCLDANPADIRPIVDALTREFGKQGWFVFDPDARGSQHPCVASWPSWLILQQIQHSRAQLRARQQRISFLSGTPRYHRLALWQHIKGHVQSDDVVVVNRFASEMWHESAVPAGKWPHCQAWLDQLPWSNNPVYIDNDQNQPAAHGCGSIDHVAYQACVNITGETVADGDVMMITEKTWKAYRAGCAVINFGHRAIPAWLASQGIEILPQDRTQHWQDKIYVIKELFDSPDVWQMYHDNKSQIEHNQRLVLDVGFAFKLARPALCKIRNLLNT